MSLLLLLSVSLYCHAQDSVSGIISSEVKSVCYPLDEDLRVTLLLYHARNQARIDKSEVNWVFRINSMSGRSTINSSEQNFDIDRYRYSGNTMLFYHPVKISNSGNMDYNALAKQLEKKEFNLGQGWGLLLYDIFNGNSFFK